VNPSAETVFVATPATVFGVYPAPLTQQIQQASLWTEFLRTTSDGFHVHSGMPPACCAIANPAQQSPASAACADHRRT